MCIKVCQYVNFSTLHWILEYAGTSKTRTQCSRCIDTAQDPKNYNNYYNKSPFMLKRGQPLHKGLINSYIDNSMIVSD